jgi:hypothetical protein
MSSSIESLLKSASEKKNPFLSGATKISPVRLLKDVETHKVLRDEKDSIIVALVSLNMPEVESKPMQRYGSVMPDEEDDLCHNHLCVLKRMDNKTIRRRYKSGINAAIRKNADVICINELGFPYASSEDLKRLISWTRNRARTLKKVIIAGSYHDRDSRYNVGHMFFPGCKDSGFRYFKQVSAIDVRECIDVPARRRSLAIEAFGFRIAVVICLDTLDYTTMTSIVNNNPQIHILLIPSYSPYIEPMEKAAVSISGAMLGAVALVNKYSSERTDSVVYINGGRSPKRPLHSRVEKDDHGNELFRLRLFRFTRKQFKVDRYKYIDIRDAEQLKLFGTVAPSISMRSG